MGVERSKSPPTKPRPCDQCPTSVTFPFHSTPQKHLSSHALWNPDRPQLGWLVASNHDAVHLWKVSRIRALEELRCLNSSLMWTSKSGNSSEQLADRAADPTPAAVSRIIIKFKSHVRCNVYITPFEAGGTVLSTKVSEAYNKQLPLYKLRIPTSFTRSGECVMGHHIRLYSTSDRGNVHSSSGLLLLTRVSLL